MAGKQAKPITNADLVHLTKIIRTQRHPERKVVALLLSVKAGLRAGEIAGLTWGMVLGPKGQLADTIELHDSVAKKCSGRTIPINPQLRSALARLKRISRCDPRSAVVLSERGNHFRASSIVNWFGVIYRRAGLEGCSSHSGRRTFITNAARRVHRVGGSLRDVQEMAGHRSIDMTQRYIVGNTRAKRALVRLV